MAKQAIKETEVEPDETTDETTSKEDNPDIEPDETADLGAALDEIDPDDVDDTADDASDGDNAADEADGADEDTAADTAPASGAWGEMYVKGLCTAANVAKSEYGDGGQTNPDLAFELDLDEHFNQWLNEQGMGDDMPPGQAVMAGTCMFLVAECLTDEKLVNNLLSEVSA